MILNKAQAEAVRDAICALNNVGMVGMVADIHHVDREADRMFWVDVGDDGRIEVSDMTSEKYEHYDDFDAFVKAYGLVP